MPQVEAQPEKPWRRTVETNKDLVFARRRLMEQGSSVSWGDALYAATGESRLNGSALREYFRPLEEWLTNENLRTAEFAGWTYGKFHRSELKHRLDLAFCTAIQVMRSLLCPVHRRRLLQAQHRDGGPGGVRRLLQRRAHHGEAPGCAAAADSAHRAPASASATVAHSQSVRPVKEGLHDCAPDAGANYLCQETFPRTDRASPCCLLAARSEAA